MEPKVINYALKMATKMYNYYYTFSIKEFGHDIADKLAKIPADYIYHKLLSIPNCYSTHECCLEYYNELIDSEFNSLDPNLKRRAYEKAFGVQSGNISVGEINLKLSAGRKNNGPKKLYGDAIIKERNDNELSKLLTSMSMKGTNSLTKEFVYSEFDKSFESMKL